VWTASFVFTLARETGWSEHFIFWELPLARLLQYQHCALRAHDVWTVPVAPPATTQLETLLTNWNRAERDSQKADAFCPEGSAGGRWQSR
jgi:hypothetical protein